MATQPNISVLALGKLTINKSGVKARDSWGGVTHSGWFLKVVDSDERYVTSFQIKTMDPIVAAQLTDVAQRGEVVSLGGYIKTENWAGKNDPANWVTVVYATQAAAAGEENPF